MKKLIIYIFMLFFASSASAKMSLDEITFLFGSAIGVVSSQSCGADYSFAKKAEKRVIGMLNYELKNNKITKSDYNSLKSKFTNIKKNDSRIKHKNKTCLSAKRVLGHLFKKRK